jgi:small multidrug resistance pump
MSPITQAYVWLAGAITAEVIGTTLLQQTAQFTRLLPSVATVALYAVSFYCLSSALKSLPLGVAYAIWGGLGILVTAIVGLVWFEQALDAPACIGIGLIVAGVVVINAFSKTVGH